MHGVDCWCPPALSQELIGSIHTIYSNPATRLHTHRARHFQRRQRRWLRWSTKRFHLPTFKAVVANIWMLCPYTSARCAFPLTSTFIPPLSVHYLCHTFGSHRWWSWYPIFRMWARRKQSSKKGWRSSARRTWPLLPLPHPLLQHQVPSPLRCVCLDAISWSCPPALFKEWCASLYVCNFWPQVWNKDKFWTSMDAS